MASKRIEYIDAMRGVTMLLVVFSHVLLYGYGNSFNDLTNGGGDLLSFNNVIVLFRMPLFFFISGFILYKKDFIWNGAAGFSFLKKKAKVQLIPTFFFLALYTFVVLDISFYEGCTNSMKLGYWFTWALFEYFCIYVLFRWICHKLGKENGMDWLLLLGGLMLYFAVTPSALRLAHLYDTLVCNALGLEQLKYFLYFALGTVVKKHFDKVQGWLDNGKITALMVLSFFLAVLYVIKNGYFENTLFTHLYLIFAGVFGLLLVFAFFRKYQTSFTQETRLGRVLQYVGRRTLDIYMLHYFFLPGNLQPVGRFFNDHVNPTLEFVVSMAFAVIVVAMCLLMSNIIRISPVLAHWLFGVKVQNK